jgi:predicted nucleic acid-binding protein
MSTSKAVAAGLLDTDVLIDFLRGVDASVKLMLAMPALHISTVSVAELFAGVKNAKEERDLVRLIDECEVHDVTRDIATHAGQWKKKYFPSHGVQIPDALIAATASSHELPLYTLNVKHYPMISGLKPAYKKL